MKLMEMMVDLLNASVSWVRFSAVCVDSAVVEVDADWCPGAAGQLDAVKDTVSFPGRV